MGNVVITKSIIASSRQPTHWDLGNKILYDLCKKNPRHESHSEVLAKVWIIGRSYAAAIERRKTDSVKINENFYVQSVAPKIINSEIDSWFEELKGIRAINEKSTPKILSVHYKVTKLFNEISKLDKRSLASKYLHFHFPNLFYIYDSRALKGLSLLTEFTGRVGKSENEADNEYRKLFEKCSRLQEYIYHTYKEKLTPRQIDNILLDLVRNDKERIGSTFVASCDY